MRGERKLQCTEKAILRDERKVKGKERKGENFLNEDFKERGRVLRFLRLVIIVKLFD